MSRSGCCRRLVTPVTQEEHAAVRAVAARYSVSMAALMRAVSVSLGVMREKRLQQMAKQLRDSHELGIQLLVRRNNWRGAVLCALAEGPLTATELERRCAVTDMPRSRDQIRKALSRLIECGVIRNRYRSGRMVLELVER